MKVTIKKLTKKTASYKLKGTDAEAVAAEIEAREHAGEYTYEPHISWKTKGGVVTEVTITPVGTTEMPVWKAYGKQCAEAKAEWDRFYVALAKHERGHELIFLESLAKAKIRLEQFAADRQKSGTPIRPADIKALYKTLFKEVFKKPQDEFDNATNHGKNKGAVFRALAAACP